MVAVAESGFRAIALDFRGYGLSDQPLELEKFSWEDLIADVLAILDSLGIPKVKHHYSLLQHQHLLFLISELVVRGIYFSWYATKNLARTLSKNYRRIYSLKEKESRDKLS